MAGECLVIALIIGVMNIGFFRANRKNWGLAVIPLGFVPLVTGLGMFAADKIFKWEYSFVLPMVLIVTSLVVACIWIGLCSVILIKTKKMRVVYLGAAVGFVFVFSLIILIRYYHLLGN